MLRLSIFCFTVALIVVVSSLYQARLAPVEKLMRVEHDNIGDAKLVLLDPASDTRFLLTKTYHEIRFVAEQDGWIYFWAKRGVTPPDNVMRLYRVNPQQNIQQELISDNHSDSFVRIIWSQKKIVYITRMGDLVSMNLDGTNRQTINIPSNMTLSVNINSWFSLSLDQEWAVVSARQGLNFDLVMIELDGDESRNLTEHLPTPHVCNALYQFEHIEFLRCNSIIYSRRSGDEQLEVLLPSTEDSEQSLMGIYEKNVLNIAELNPEETAIYAIDLDQTTYPLTYTRVDKVPSILARANDWQIVREQKEDHFELWHVQNDDTRTKVGEFDVMPFTYPMANNYHLVIVSDSVRYITDIYQLSQDGRQLKHLRQTIDLILPIGTSFQKDTFYFAQATSYRPRAFQLKGIDIDGNTQTYSGWHQHDRLIGWSDIFARDWSSTKWWLMGLAAMSMLFLLTVSRQQQILY